MLLNWLAQADNQELSRFLPAHLKQILDFVNREKYVSEGDWYYDINKEELWIIADKVHRAGIASIWDEPYLNALYGF